MLDQTKNNTLNSADVRLPKDLPLETPFWTFSLAIWKNPAVQAALLSLQDQHELKVNRLLFASWLGIEQRDLLADALTADPLLALWNEQAVSPLRTIRKQLKITAPDHPQLRATVQNAELQAEQIEQALLFQRVGPLSRPTTKRNTLETLSSNLLSYTGRELGWSVLEGQAPLIHPHLVTLVQAVIPTHDRSHIESCFSL